MTATKPKKAVPLEVSSAEQMKKWHEVMHDETVAGMMSAALEGTDAGLYAILADAIEDAGETILAAVVRTLGGEAFGLSIGERVYVGFPKAAGVKPWFTVCYKSPRMRSRWGETESFHSLTNYVSFVLQHLSWEWRKHAKKEEKKQANKTMKGLPNPFKVGDVLHWSGGYNMTYNLYIQVVATTARQITVRRISREVLSTSAGGSERVRPVVGAFTGEPYRITIRPTVPVIEGDLTTGWSVAEDGRYWHRVSPTESHYENTND